MIQPPTIFKCKATQCVDWHVFPGEERNRIHRNCTHNEINALRNRVLQRTPTAHPVLYGLALKAARRVAWALGKITPDLDGSWIEKYSGRKYTIYKAAQAEYEHSGVKFKHSMLRSFVKLEKISQPQKDCRLIQARDPVFNYAVGRWLKPIEHNLYKLGQTKFPRGMPKTRAIAKCLTLGERATLIKQKFDRFNRPVCFSLDCSRFDAHVNAQQLALEHSVYRRLCPDAEFNRLLDWQFANRGFTKTGVYYRCPGGRMSGDMNTATGNCLLVYIMIYTAVRLHRIRPEEFDIFIDGDDTLVFVEQDNEELAHKLISVLEGFGHEVKLENRATDMESIVHCQSQPVELAPGDWRMVQHPRRVISRYLLSSRHFRARPNKNHEHLYQLGTCAAAVFDGVPILQKFSACLVKAGKPTTRIRASGRVWQASRELNARETFYLTVTQRARESFNRAFGIPPHEQELWEHYFNILDLRDGHH